MDKVVRGSRSRARWTVVICFVLALAMPAFTVSAQSRFSGIVVFGTSLSDSGNAYALVGDQSTPPDFTLNPLLVPSAPYARGGHHFSNGATWVEQFARSHGLEGSVHPAFATKNLTATNYAVGAARAYDDGINFNLTRQVDTFLQRSGPVASSQALYVIEMGGNDVRDAFQVYAAGGNGGPIVAQALGSISTNIRRLYEAGATEFLVWVTPNIAMTPALRSFGPAAGAFATQITQAFNGGLNQVLAQLSQGLPGIRLVRLDAYRILNDIVANPGAFGFTTTATACLTPDRAPFVCDQVDEFLFWDGIHPTKAGHAILAQETANVVQ